MLPVRRYAMVLAMALCLSVTSRCSVETVDGLIWFLAWRLLFVQCFKEIQVYTEIRVLPSGTFS